jgi:hypothetical protein
MHAPSEPEKTHGSFVKRRIREQKARKDRPAVARTHACAREKFLKQAADLADLLADQDASGAITVLRAGLEEAATQTARIQRGASAGFK